MDWIYIVAVAVVIGGLYAWKRSSFVSMELAHKLLRDGAVVIDVRTGSEFASGHVPDAVNLDLASIRSEVVKQFPDRSRPMLLHCHSGGRSAIAKMQLKSLGYNEVHNLGSFRRAAKTHQTFQSSALR